MADYLSRHPSPSNKNNQIKAEELWNGWFTINKIDHEENVLNIQNRKGTTSQQPIRQTRNSNREPNRKRERAVGKRKTTNQT